MSALRRLARGTIGRLPPVRRRDTVIRELRSRVRARERRIAQLEEDLAASREEAGSTRRQLARRGTEARRWRRMVEEPSWHAHVRHLRRVHGVTGTLPDGEDMPIRSVSRKLANYRLAASHGVATPRVLAVWSDADEVDLHPLPEAFTIKADRGAASRAVYPVRRRGPLLEVADGSRTLTAEDLVRELRDTQAAGEGLPPHFAEELLEDSSGAPLPVDIKVYTFYGEIGHVLLRAVHRHGDPRGTRRRYLLPDGSDLLQDNHTEVPVPRHYETVLEVARTLSTVVPFPFLRVDLYDTPSGVVIGELTMAPGGPQRYPDGHDRRLGRMLEEAEARLYQDLYDGRPYAFLYGDAPTDHLPDVRHAPDSPVARWPGSTRRTGSRP